MIFNVCAAAGANTGIYADLACAAILLLFLIIGLCKGFIKQAFGLIGSIAAFVLASVLCGIVVKGLNGAFGIVDGLAASLNSKMGSSEWLSLSINEENIRNACSELLLPDFIADFAVNQAAEMVGSYENLGEFISHSLANLIISAAAYIVLFVILKIVINLLRKLLEKLFTLPGLKTINKFLGSVLGLVKGLIVVYVVLFFISIIPSSEGIISDVKQAVDSSSITSFFANNNVFAMAITWIASKFGVAA